MLVVTSSPETDAQIIAWLERYPMQVMTEFSVDVFVCGYCTALHTGLAQHARTHIRRGDDSQPCYTAMVLDLYRSMHS